VKHSRWNLTKVIPEEYEPRGYVSFLKERAAGFYTCLLRMTGSKVDLCFWVTLTTEEWNAESTATGVYHKYTNNV